ncbi:MAG: hypothetical protein HC923_01560, partial [Myxococcales bacterium]|nr:hypothetical protein [Myxococcales bacterium]
MSRTIGSLGEDAIIELFAGGGHDPTVDIVVGNGDDAAAWMPDPGRAQVVTTDGLTDGVHFLLGTTPRASIGRKLLAVNLSDLAAMGAVPRFAIISAVLPANLELRALEEITEGLHEASLLHRVPILGGNVGRTMGPMVLSATVIGVNRLRARGRGSERGRGKRGDGDQDPAENRWRLTRKDADRRCCSASSFCSGAATGRSSSLVSSISHPCGLRRRASVWGRHACSRPAPRAIGSGFRRVADLPVVL